ncbi:MAG: hypothetical protein M1821_007117 [Bathelium mastoideum]|nr:MAG: hypothetical protein M1821_007117 [Bathelium mastoideum]KAI9694628.1 MAG: hypothetical protein M1822_000244 [Bathelium mastoideum]
MNESLHSEDVAATGSSGASNVSASSAYAFLVHSQQTLPHNLPPNVDNKSLARQKRRRTSPEDQAILETEYSRNPKPDKNARQEIVKRVALGDKEVQIWFQNRRQNDRRKSRPLLPHELLPRSLLPLESDSDAIATQYTQGDGQDRDEKEDQTETRDTQQPLDTNLAADECKSSSQDTVGSASNEAGGLSQLSAETVPTTCDSHSSQQTEVTQDRQLPYTGYLANRRSASFQRTSSELLMGEAVESNSSDTRIPRHRSLRKSSSQVRISLTSDGNAKVLTNEDSSPSPPRPASATAAATSTRGRLSRSQSAIGLGQASARAEIEPFRDIRPRGAPGRSRDSRAWEFWCDSDARNALAQKASQDAGGSAADAIGLMRSNSRNVLGSNANKRNAPLLKRDSGKRLKTGTSGQLKLGRSTAELGSGKMKEVNIAEDVGSYSRDIDVPNNESDKENWEPGQQTESQGYAKIAHLQKNEKTMRRVLGESNNVPSKSSSLGAMMAREKGSKRSSAYADAENVDPEDDPEIAEFMGASRKRGDGTNALGEDLDCVQGLLSLSQGNWQ